MTDEKKQEGAAPAAQEEGGTTTDSEADKGKHKDTGSESQDHVPSQIEEAKAAVAEMKQQNKIMEAHVKDLTRLAAENILGGRAPAGAKAETHEDKVTAEARKILAGTGYEDQLFPVK